MNNNNNNNNDDDDDDDDDDKLQNTLKLLLEIMHCARKLQISCWLR